MQVSNLVMLKGRAFYSSTNTRKQASLEPWEAVCGPVATENPTVVGWLGVFQEQGCSLQVFSCLQSCFSLLSIKTNSCTIHQGLRDLPTTEEMGSSVGVGVEGMGLVGRELEVTQTWICLSHSFTLVFLEAFWSIPLLVIRILPALLDH